MRCRRKLRRWRTDASRATIARRKWELSAFQDGPEISIAGVVLDVGQRLLRLMEIARFEPPPHFLKKWGLSPLTEADQPTLVRHGHGLGARDGIQLGEDGLHVRLRRALGDLEAPRDVLV